MDYMKAMGALSPKSIAKSQKGGPLRAINLIKEKIYMEN